MRLPISSLTSWSTRAHVECDLHGHERSLGYASARELAKQAAAVSIDVSSCCSLNSSNACRTLPS